MGNMAVVERTDREIHEAWLRLFRGELANSKTPDKPVMGCMSHLLSLRQIVKCFETVLRGEELGEELANGMSSLLDTESIREVARLSGEADVVAMIDGQSRANAQRRVGTRRRIGIRINMVPSPKTESLWIRLKKKFHNPLF